MQLNIQLPQSAAGVRLFDTAGKPVLSQILSVDTATHQFTLLARVSVPALGYTVLRAGPADAANPTGPDGFTITEKADSYIIGNNYVGIDIDKRPAVSPGSMTTIATRR